MSQEIADSKLIDTWGSSGAKIEPDITKIIEGWQLGEQPPHEYMNWLQNTFGSKLNHILKNGVASWNVETEYLAGATVQHNGNVWICKATNTNSAPTDANANWKRIITVESLTTILSGYVALTGDQTIAGIKTFSSSPIVPTPTTGDNSPKVANTAFVKAQSEAVSIGVNQTYQNMTASRSLDVTYTNNSGKPIYVNIFLSSNISGYKNASFYVDNIRINSFSTQPTTTTPQGITVHGLVPISSTYRVSLDPSSTAMSVTFWQELR